MGKEVKEIIQEVIAKEPVGELTDQEYNKLNRAIGFISSSGRAPEKQELPKEGIKETTTKPKD